MLSLYILWMKSFFDFFFQIIFMNAKHLENKNQTGLENFKLWKILNHNIICYGSKYSVTKGNKIKLV